AAERDQVLRRGLRLPVRHYADYFDPTTVPPAADEVVEGDLANDIAEVFDDVSRGLALFDQGRIPDALWEWIFGFQSHWGRHATVAIRVLHAYVAGTGW